MLSCASIILLSNAQQTNKHFFRIIEQQNSNNSNSRKRHFCASKINDRKLTWNHEPKLIFLKTMNHRQKINFVLSMQ